MATTKKPPAKKADKPEKTVKPAAKTVRKPRVKKEVAPVEHKVVQKAEHAPVSDAPEIVHEEADKSDKVEVTDGLGLKAGKYSWAVGRRKTAVANVRLFSGKEKSTVNKKDLSEYFSKNALFIEELNKPLQLTGLQNKVYVYVNAKGGGLHAQAQAIAHGISWAIIKHTPEFRKILKKNGCLTRDSRMKERKKPGLKRARRGPQWAKR